MLTRPASPGLTYTKFAPARPDATIKWPGAQIWQGNPRADSLLLADCIDEEWAKSLATAYNDGTVMTTKIAAANQVIRELLVAISESARECKLAQPEIAEALSGMVATFTKQAKQAGLSPV